MTVFEKIEAQRKGKENTPVWMVGQQLMDICRGDEGCAQIVSEDLENKDMGIASAAKKIKDWADEQHKKQKGNCVCVPPDVAERIIREFYGLPVNNAGDDEPTQEQTPEDAEAFDLSSFF